jgi:hypothetical protein
MGQMKFAIFTSGIVNNKLPHPVFLNRLREKLYFFKKAYDFFAAGQH